MAKYKLGDIVTLLNGRAYLMPELQDSGKYRILRVGNLSGGNDSWYYSDMELDENKYCENGDLLYAWACNFGPHIWREEKVIYHYHIWKLVENKEKVDRTYLYYYLLHQTPFYLGGVNGATMVHITKKNMEKKTVYIPSSLNVQHRIASILSTYDSLIENNTKRIRLLEKMAENIYKEWFVRFRFPGHENVEMENGLPKGWKRGSLSDVCEFKRGKNITSSEMQEGNVPVISAGLEPSGYHSCSNVRGVNVTMSSSGANAGYIAIHYSDIWAADCSYIEESTTGNIYYVYELLNNIRTVINNFQRGAAQPHVYPKDVNRIKLILPSKELMLIANGRLEIMHKEIYNLQKQNSLLARQRDLLLPRLMSGKLEVKEELLE